MKIKSFYEETRKKGSQEEIYKEGRKAGRLFISIKIIRFLRKPGK